MLTESFTSTWTATTAVLTIVAIICVTAPNGFSDRAVKKYKQHSMERAKPAKVTPGKECGDPASDAIVLFDGKNLDKWVGKKGKKPKWKVKDGYIQVVPDTGHINTKQKFGDCHLHVEWKIPADIEGHGQHRGNSGVFFGYPGVTPVFYEIQVLDTYENETYADGMAGSIYGQYPPLVNACRPPGKWQTFDIIWRSPRFDDNGEVQKPATLTVFHNGVLVQDSEALTGPTAHKKRPPYKAHGKLPVALQDHGHAVMFRNIWVRPLDESKR